LEVHGSLFQHMPFPCYSPLYLKLWLVSWQQTGAADLGKSTQSYWLLLLPWTVP